MRLIIKTLPVNFNYFLYSCDHEGDVLRHKKGFEKMCHMMHSEYEGCKKNFAWDHGDPIEGIEVNDPRYHYATVDPKTPLPMLQMYQAIKSRKPIAHMILGMNESNHPKKLWRFGPITQTMCDELKVPYATWTGKLIARDSRGQLLFKSYHTHGKKPINSMAPEPITREATLKRTLKNQLRLMAGDCILMSKAHTHKLIVVEPEKELYMTDDGEKIKQGYTDDYTHQTDEFIHPDHRTYVCAGSFLRLFGDGVSGYAEEAEYPPIELGFAIARFRDRQLVKTDKIYLD